MTHGIMPENCLKILLKSWHILQLAVVLGIMKQNTNL